MKDLTLRQQEILGYLQLHSRNEGYWPSIREIQAHFGFKSTNAVMGHLRALERKGYISRVGGQARAFRVTYDTGDTPPATSAEVVDIPIEKITGEVYELEDQMAMMVRAVRDNVPLTTSGEDGKWSVAMCVAAERSVETGQPVLMKDVL